MENEYYSIFLKLTEVKLMWTLIYILYLDSVDACGI